MQSHKNEGMIQVILDIMAEDSPHLMTLPRARRPQLIVTDSLKRMPTAPVRFALSEPAKSTYDTQNQ